MFSKKVVLLGISVLIGIAIVQRSVKAWAGETSQARTSEAISQVQAVKPLSLNLVDDAITVLAQGWPEMSRLERDTFLMLYDPAGTGNVDEQFVGTVLGNYRKIRQTLENEIEVVYGGQNEKCEGQRLYYTDTVRLYVCPYFFEEENELRKARTLIHEAAHMALLVADRPYYRPTSQAYADLTPHGSPVTKLPLVGPVLREVLRGDTLYHPDAYAHYALHSAGYSNIYGREIN